MRATLFGIPGSHPSMAVRLELELKGIEYRRVDLVASVSRPILRALRFPGVTVPALTVDGRRVQGSREIARFLDELVPEPPLFPADPERRAAVEEVERWGDEVYQEVARRISWWSLKRDRSQIHTFLEGARLGVPVKVAAATSAPIVALTARLDGASDAAVRSDLEALPDTLARVDAWIAEGVLGGETPNAADFQIATTTRLLMCFDDLRAAIESRPCGEHARRIVSSFPGHMPSVLRPDERPAGLAAAA